MTKKENSERNTIIVDDENNYFLAITSKTYGLFICPIDPQDIPAIQEQKWHVQKGSGWKGREFYIRGIDNVLFHRYLMNPPKDMQVDHIDGQPINNRRSNLRIVTHAQNQHNQIGAKGYCWQKRAEKWSAQIKKSGKHIYLGLFETEAEARQAYLDAKKIYHLMPVG